MSLKNVKPELENKTYFGNVKNEKKYGLPILNADNYSMDPDRYILIDGHFDGAPSCPYGNYFQWLVLDSKTESYVRATSSVFKKLIQKKENQ